MITFPSYSLMTKRKRERRGGGGARGEVGEREGEREKTKLWHLHILRYILHTEGSAL